MLTALLFCTLFSLQQEGGAVLLEAARALENDRQVLDTITIETTARGTSVRVQADLVLGSGGSGELRRGNIHVVIQDDWASVTHAAKRGIYFVAEADGPTIALLLGLTDSPTSLLPHFALRQAGDEEEALAAFQSDWEDEVTLTGCRELPREDGKGPRLLEVDLRHAEGEEQVLIERDSGLLRQRLVRRGDRKMTITHRLRVGDQSARPFVFDEGERKLVPELLDVLTVTVGDEAPPFRVKDLSGKEQSLADARTDSMVLLDLWATWCRPCRKGLKELKQYADARDLQAAGVRILAVNVSERVEGEERLEAVRSFWEQGEYSFPTLLDPDDSLRLAYGADEIPLTVLVGKDGIVKAVHGDGDLIEWLEKSLAAAGK